MTNQEGLNIVLVGATSAIIHATAREFCREEPNLFLVGRNESKLKDNAGDLKVRGAKKCEIFISDLEDEARFESICNAASDAFGKIDLVLIGHGFLGDQKDAESNLLSAKKILEVNFLKQALLVGEFANALEKQKSGTLAVITSVAGDRGRPSNYVYGSAKAGMIAFLDGLRSRLFKSGVRVLDIRPGVVNTPMTEGLKSKPFAVDPGVVARMICNGFHGKASVIYVPKKWQYIMLIIRSIPRFIFNRLSL